MANRVLVVIDMQHDFVDGALGTPEARAIAPAVEAEARAFPGEVIFTLDTHGANYLATQEGEHLPVPHCIKGTPGWELIEGLEQLRQERDARTFEKPTFGSLELARYLAAQHEQEPLESIELIGVCTDICVVSNALLIKAYLPEVPLCVDAALCAGVTPQAHEAALATLASCQVEIRNA